MIRKCATCGTKIDRRPSSLMAKKVFCDHKCYAKDKKLRWSKDNNPRWRGGSDKLKCVTCGKPFTVKKFGESRKSKFCSKTCATLDRSKNLVGSKHWNWKGGIGARHLRRTAPPKPDKCQICGDPAKNFKFGLVLDHCHKKNKFRGWLCTNCNTALGLVKEDINRLELLKQYLIRNENSL